VLRKLYKAVNKYLMPYRSSNRRYVMVSLMTRFMTILALTKVGVNKGA